MPDPRGASSGSPVTSTLAINMSAMTLKPHFLPKNIADAAIGLMVFSIQSIGLLLLPGVIVFLAVFLGLSGRVLQSYNLAYSILFGFLAPCIVYLAFLMFTVWSIDISKDGIYFYRLLGCPKKLSWDSITDVSLAPRGELILKGWLWPLLPAREMTPTLSSLGHNRISWDKGNCYFPPADGQAFECEVNKHIRTKG